MPFPFSLPFALPFQKDPERERLVAELSQDLTLAAASRGRARGEAGERREKVRRYQSARLRSTHQELLADPRFKAAAAFFLNEIYAERAPAWRDEQMRKALPAMSRFLPAIALEPVVLAVRLDSVTESLDERLANALPSQASGSLTEQAYADAYRQSSAEERQEQLELIERVCERLARAARIPLVPQALAAMRGPARALGVFELHSFLERGFSAFKSLERPELFIQAFLVKERALSAELFAAGERVSNPLGQDGLS